MRVTILKPGVFTEFGISAPVGTTIEVGGDYGKSLVASLQASDTDGVLSAPQNTPFDSSPASVGYQASVSGGGLPTLVPYATTIPLDAIKYMAATAVSGPVVFTAGATKTPGASCQLTLVADGTNVPTFSGFFLWGGSSPYNKTAGAVNELTFFVVGTRAYYTIMQATPVEISSAAAQWVRFLTLANMTETVSAGGGWDYATTSTANQVAKGPNLSLAADGYVEATLQTAGTTTSWILGLDANPSAVNLYTGLDYAIYPANTGFYKAFVGGTNVVTPTGSATIANTVGDKMRLTRTGSSISMDIIRGGSTINLHTVTGVAAGVLSPVATGINLSGVKAGPVAIVGGA